MNASCIFTKCLQSLHISYDEYTTIIVQGDPSIDKAFSVDRLPVSKRQLSTSGSLFGSSAYIVMPYNLGIFVKGGYYQIL